MTRKSWAPTPAMRFLALINWTVSPTFSNFSLLQQRLGLIAGNVNADRAFIHRLLDLGIAAVGVEPDLGKPLHLAAALPMLEQGRIFLHDPGVDGIDAVGLGQLEGLANLGRRVVAPHQRGDVGQVARVRVTANQIAAQKQAAELLVLYLAHRHLVRGGGGRSTTGCGGILGRGPETRIPLFGSGLGLAAHAQRNRRCDQERRLHETAARNLAFHEVASTYSDGGCQGWSGERNIEKQVALVQLAITATRCATSASRPGRLRFGRTRDWSAGHTERHDR